jgi:signal transduction histidine kinase
VFRTLYRKLSAVLLALFLLVGALFVSLTLYTTRVHLQESNQRLNRDLARHIASGTELFEGGHVRPEAAHTLFDLLMSVHPAIEVYLLDPAGRILAFSAPPGKVKRERVSLGPVRQFLEGMTAFPIAGDDPRDPSRRKTFSAAPIPPAGAPQGYLYIILGGEEADSVSQMLQGSYILRLSLLISVASLLFALFAGLLLFYRLTVRHRRLAAAVEEFERSGFSRVAGPWVQHRASEEDEIDRLANAFTRMEEKIVLQIREIREADAHRRELVSHVSHDLRTPLTSLQGYLETLSMKEGLSDRERSEYLSIALSHCRRMRNLIFDLFELARLESPDLQVRPERFSLGDLVQDVLMKFRLDAGRKGIRLEMEAADLPFAFADIGLIDRVLANLVGNAVRHTPENGEVAVRAISEGERLRIRVSDTGPGIPPERLAGLFDRGALQEGEPGKRGAAGLGLVIARKILELHGSTLTVESREGAGTTFSFNLPVTKS